MDVWLIWIQGDDATWLAEAWDDESTADENTQGWQEAVLKAKTAALEGGYEVRIQRVKVPGVYELFEIPTAKAEVVS